ncbi:MAG: M15 family metallopeptidase [Nitrospirota bacterium]
MKLSYSTAALLLLILFCVLPLYDNETAKTASLPAEPARKYLSVFEQQLLKMGFADVQEIDPTIKVELKYASSSNFMGANVYGDLTKGYLRREAAEKLAKANHYLKQLHPHLTLLVVDALRPRHVQRKMRGILEGTPMKQYVADPSGGSMHNYGCAVDITIIDDKGNRLDMGTPMDHFGMLSQPRHETRFLKEGKLTAEQIANRRLLRSVMTAAGFRPLPIEWWHFEAFEKKFIRKTYTIVE